ncbi:MAG: hypothetical protein ACRDDY_08355 [Clostridium sp.]|uniref:hypothetical protein n=1 Tax=Clostridium sp. TaxID=1506 RepID=UPI003EE42A64
MVYNILGHIASFFFIIILVSLLVKVAWLMIPGFIRSMIIGSLKGICFISEPIRAASKEVQKDICKDISKKRKKKAKAKAVAKKKKDDKDDENKNASYKSTKHSHLKIVK